MPTDNPYQNALDVQDACNLSGVVLQFAIDMQTIWDNEPGLSTEDRNTHPVVMMYVDKLASLTHRDLVGATGYHYAKRMCEQQARVWVAPEKEMPSTNRQKNLAVAKAGEGEIVFECPEETCHQVETVTAAWMAEHGTPVCPDCDSDMVYEP